MLCVAPNGDYNLHVSSAYPPESTHTQGIEHTLRNLPLLRVIDLILPVYVVRFHSIRVYIIKGNYYNVIHINGMLHVGVFGKYRLA